MARAGERRRRRCPSRAARRRRRRRALGRGRGGWFCERQRNVRGALVDSADGALFARGLHRVLVAVLAALGQHNIHRDRGCWWGIRACVSRAMEADVQSGSDQPIVHRSSRSLTVYSQHDTLPRRYDAGSRPPRHHYTPRSLPQAP
jgi:hypothetical protein